MAYTEGQLNSFWNRYVAMKQVDVISVTSPDSAAYEPEFDNMLGYVYRNRMFGFADLNRKYSGKGSASNSAIFNGPQTS